jgi:hypothetical protein
MLIFPGAALLETHPTVKKILVEFDSGVAAENCPGRIG